jgi:hypothetical protein
MRDFLLVACILSASAVIGYPACLLLSAARFKARFIAAPTIGFSVLSAALILLYACGVPPRISQAAMSTIGLLGSAVHLIHGRTGKSRLLTAKSLTLDAATFVVVVLCLSPAWIGGPQFAVFQDNAYDQLNVCLPGSVVSHQYDYAAVVASVSSEAAAPSSAKFARNRPISMPYAAFAGIANSNAAHGSYASMVALQNP